MLIPRRHAAAAPPASRPRPRRRRPAHRRALAQSWRGRRGRHGGGRLRALLRGLDRRGEGDSRRRALGQALLEGGGGREQRIQHGPVAGLGAAQVADGLHGIAERAGPVARRRLRASRQPARGAAARWRKRPELPAMALRSAPSPASAPAGSARAASGTARMASAARFRAAAPAGRSLRTSTCSSPRRPSPAPAAPRLEHFPHQSGRIVDEFLHCRATSKMKRLSQRAMNPRRIPVSPHRRFHPIGMPRSLCRSAACPGEARELRGSIPHPVGHAVRTQAGDRPARARCPRPPARAPCRSPTDRARPRRWKKADGARAAGMAERSM